MQKTISGKHTGNKKKYRTIRREPEQYREAQHETVPPKVMQHKTAQERILTLLYETLPGRMLLRPLTAPWFSKAGGWLLDTRLSTLAIRPFARANKIDLSPCKKTEFCSFNDFFTRELWEDARPVAVEAEAFVSPCDCRLSVFPVTEGGAFTVKHTVYTLPQLLRNADLARRYQGGWLWLCRLSVDDYHRYIYPDNARVSRGVHIPGILHTVNPIANDHYPIYKENTREYCLLQTEQFGTVLMMEVGALLVGKIENHPVTGNVIRGQEKGYFAFGGSTILLLTRQGTVEPERVYLENTKRGAETRVRLGEKIGHSLFWATERKNFENVPK